MSKMSKQIIEGIMAKPDDTSPIKGEDLLSTGSTLLNLAMSGRPTGGHCKGCYTFVLGDSGAGKTIMALTTLACASINSNFDDYRLIHDDVENGNKFDIPRLFGEKLADRLEPPALDSEGSAKHSKTIEDFYFNLLDALDGDKPCIYILDSMDSLSSEAELKKLKTNKSKWKRGAELEGSYGDGKAKKNSEMLRGIVKKVEETKSILIIINQTRALMNAGPFQEPDTWSGGRALKFYAHIMIMIKQGMKIKKDINGKQRSIGTHLIFKLKKNRLTGQLHDGQCPIFWSYGMDDIGSCIDWLIFEKWWKKTKGKINAGERFGLMHRNELIKEVEGGKMKELRAEVRDCWKEIQRQSMVARKPRFA